MPIPKKIINYLDKNKVKYEVVEHRKVFTAYDAAQTLHVKVSQIAKNLLIKAGKTYILAILPADRNLDFSKLGQVIGAAKVSLPKEGVMQKLFKVKPGALPAFGGVYKIPVFLDKTLLKEKKLIFSSGSFTESIKMSLSAYKKLEQPRVGAFSIAKKIKKQKPVKKSSVKKVELRKKIVKTKFKAKKKVVKKANKR